jgi:cell surface protein SprA
VNYDLPINKIPLFSFVKSTYSYTGNYSWQKASNALSSVEAADGTLYNLGNTIQNSASNKLNTTFNMDGFYKYIGLAKRTKKGPQATPKVAPKPGQKVVNTQPQQNTSDGNVFIEGLRGVLTSVKNIQINYTENKGTALPGYLPGLGFLGTSKPTLGFVFGSQDDVRFEAAKNGWLTNYPEFNQNFTQVTTKTLNFTANMDLFPDFKIDLNAERTFAENFSEQFDVSSGGQYNSRSPYSTGNFAISTVMLKTSFRNSDINESSAFNDFRGNRIIVANRLAQQYYNSSSYPMDAEGYPVGFGKNSQAVLLPSFLAAYTGLISDKIGQSASGVSLSAFRNIPIPNWTAKYSGLMKFEFFKEKFKRFSLQHSYKASYTINSFRSNLEYNLNPNGIDAGGNFLNKTIIANINLVEQFNPLIRIDFELKNSMKFLAEMKKDRALSMSFDNNLLTEVQGIEYVVGMGYRFKDVAFTSKFADDPTGIIKGDINIKFDFSYRNNQTMVRYLDYDNNQLAGGQNIWSAKLTADYSLSKNLTAIFYYDHSFSKAVISTSFPMTNIRGGFTLRYNFGN